MSTIPRPIFKHLIGIGAVLAAALLLGFPAPAHADGSVLVSNIKEDGTDRTGSQYYDIAQGFTTGTVGDYDLGSIEVNIAFTSNTPIDSVIVKLLAADTSDPNETKPGDALCTLDNPNNPNSSELESGI